MQKRIYKSIALAASVALFASGCSGGNAGAGPAQDKVFDNAIPLDTDFDPESTFTFAWSQPPSSFDPAKSTGGLDQTYLTPMYDRLVQATPEGDLKPMLAEKFEVDEEASTITFMLRQDVTFHDGEAFNANVVEQNLNRAQEEQSTLFNEVRPITEIETVDEFTVRLKLDGGLASMLSILSGRAGMMVSPKSIDAGDTASTPVGAGPYIATSATPGERVVLEPFDDYWNADQEGEQNVAKMELIGVQEAQTRLNGLNSGEYDGAVIEESNTAGIASGTQILSGVTSQVYYVALNTTHDQLQDPRVFEAINYAIDRKSISEGLFNGSCDPQVTPWVESSFAYNDEIGAGLDIFPYDPEKAQNLLEEAGYADPAAGIDLAHSNSTGSSQMAEIVQSQLAEVGITVNPRGQAVGGIIEEFVASERMPATVLPYTGGPDPDTVYNRLLSPSAIYNPGGWENEELTKLGESAGNNPNLEERAEAYQRMAEIITQEDVSPIVSICAPKRFIALSEDVSNVEIFGDYQEVRYVAVS